MYGRCAELIYPTQKKSSNQRLETRHSK